MSLQKLPLIFPLNDKNQLTLAANPSRFKGFAYFILTCKTKFYEWTFKLVSLQNRFLKPREILLSGK